jgi:hypothetical protein
MTRDSGGTQGTNRLLDALPVADRERLMRLLRPVFLDIRTVLFEPGQAVVSVDFPVNCVVSLVTPFGGGAIVDVATVGNEGIVGVPLVIGSSLAVRAICSVAGEVLRTDASTYLHEVERRGPLRAVVDDYLQALFGQIAQAAACNRLHSTEQRLSRWLLMSQDRVGVDKFAVTHMFSPPYSDHVGPRCRCQQRCCKKRISSGITAVKSPSSIARASKQPRANATE